MYHYIIFWSTNAMNSLMNIFRASWRRGTTTWKRCTADELKTLFDDTHKYSPQSLNGFSITMLKSSADYWSRWFFQLMLNIKSKQDVKVSGFRLRPSNFPAADGWGGTEMDLTHSGLDLLRCLAAVATTFRDGFSRAQFLAKCERVWAIFQDESNSFLHDTW